MKIASKRTLDDMDIAAELRAQGASWDNIRGISVIRGCFQDAANPVLHSANELPRPT
jgi:hypothetical protein